MGVLVRVYPDAWQSSGIQYLNVLAGQLQLLTESPDRVDCSASSDYW